MLSSYCNGDRCYASCIIIQTKFYFNDNDDHDHDNNNDNNNDDDHDNNNTAFEQVVLFKYICIILCLDFNINVVRNGDAETGPCSVSGELPGPSIWKYNGNVTQLSYSDPVTISQRVTSPGPRYRKPIIFHAYNVLFFSDRGNCYFCGGYGIVSSMWQTVNLSHYIDLYYIDNQIAKYNLSAWIGGLTNQDDNGALSLRFLDQFNQIIGSVVALGPILAADRRNITKLVPCQTQGVIPLGTYFFKIEVIFNLVNGGFNNGNIDNIAVTIYA